MIKQSELLKTWNTLVAHHDEMEQLVLDLIACHDATPEQVATVRSKLIESRENMRVHHWDVMQKVGQTWRGEPRRPLFMQRRR